MLLQPKIVKTVNKWHASSINLTYCVRTQRDVYQRAMHIIFEVRIFSTIGFRQSEIGIILPIPIVYR
jgi:hypothetical protein